MTDGDKGIQGKCVPKILETQACQEVVGRQQQTRSRRGRMSEGNKQRVLEGGESCQSLGMRGGIRMFVGSGTMAV